MYKIHHVRILSIHFVRMKKLVTKDEFIKNILYYRQSQYSENG